MAIRTTPCWRALRTDTGIAYDERMQGTLQLFRGQKQVDAAHKDTEVPLRRRGHPTRQDAIERVDESGEIGFVIEDGAVVTKEKA